MSIFSPMVHQDVNKLTPRIMCYLAADRRKVWLSANLVRMIYFLLAESWIRRHNKILLQAALWTEGINLASDGQ